jgi:predicted RND superfamily exporter protein
MFSLEIHTEATSVIANLAAMVLAVTNANAGSVAVPFSLAGFIGGDQSFIVSSLLTSLNIFTLWQIVLLTIGVSIVCGFGKTKSTLIVLLVWSLSTMFNLGAMKLLQDQLHLLL